MLIGPRVSGERRPIERKPRPLDDLGSDIAPKIERRLKSLKAARAPLEQDLRDIAAYIDPRNASFFGENRKTSKDETKIVNRSAKLALRTLASGLLYGLSSPSRPWFAIGIEDADLAQWGPVRDWLHVNTQRMLMKFARSLIYRALLVTYRDESLFGNSGFLVDEGDEGKLGCHVLPVGEFLSGADRNGLVNTVYRETQLTVGQMMLNFGDNNSKTVKRMYDRSDTESKVPVVQAIEPNDDRLPDVDSWQGMAYRSAWLEPGSKNGRLLKLSGYREKPAFIGRWDTVGNDAWGTGCGHDVLNCVKGLQSMEINKHVIIQQMAKPSIVMPSQLAKDKTQVRNYPNGITYADVPPSAGGRRLFEVPTDIGPLVNEIMRSERFIDEVFFKSTFAMIASRDEADPRMTATEILERREEKMILLGPMVVRVQDDVFAPLIERAFNIMARNNELTPPPQELADVDYTVEYVGPLAQAQKAVAVGNIQRLAGFVGLAAGLDPQAPVKFDAKQAIDEFASATGVTPRVVRPDDEVEKILQGMAQQQRQQQLTEMAGQAVNAAETLSKTSMEPGSALAMLAGR